MATGLRGITTTVWNTRDERDSVVEDRTSHKTISVADNGFVTASESTLAHLTLTDKGGRRIELRRRQTREEFDYGQAFNKADRVVRKADRLEIESKSDWL